MQHQLLLPIGFCDFLKKNAVLGNKITNYTQQFFSRYGYDVICPPLVEFEENLLVDTGISLNQDKFRLLDPLSHKMMCVRSDITPQIAIIAASRLYNHPKALRLSYIGDVLRVKNDAGSRQRTQAGIELIGSNSINADIEIIRLICNNVLALGIEDISIDFSLPILTDQVIANLQLDELSKHKLQEFIRKKNIDGIAEIVGSDKNILLALNNVNHCVASAVDTLYKLDLPDAVKNICEDFKKIIVIIYEILGDKISITVDLLEYRYSSYHTGICFAVFSTKKLQEIATGGRYTVKVNDNNNFFAVGGTLYIDNLLNSLDNTEISVKKLCLPLSVDVNIADKLQQDGYITISALENADDEIVNAKKLGCGYLYRTGQVVAI